MLTLDATNKTLEVVLAGAVTTSQLPVVACYTDWTPATSAQTLAETDTATNNTTAVTAVPAPASGVDRVVNYLSVYNKDTASATVTVRLNNNTTIREEVKATLSPGQTLQYTRQGGWNSGSPFSVTLADGAATTLGAQADSAAATDTSTTSLVGLFKRLLQRVTTLLGVLPSALGITTKAASLSVAIASDQTVGVNLAQLNTQTPDTNSGLKSAGTLRVVLATDQPTLNLPQPENISQWGGTALPAAAALADGTANPTAPLVGAPGLLWNGTTWDRQPSLLTGTLLASGARTTSQFPASVPTKGCRSLTVFLNITAASGTGGLYVLLFLTDPLSGGGTGVNQALAVPIKATGCYGFTVCPGVKDTGTGLQGTSQFTPTALVSTQFTAQLIAGDASSYTYSLSYALLR